MELVGFIGNAHHAEVGWHFIGKKFALEVRTLDCAMQVENLTEGVSRGAFDPFEIEAKQATEILRFYGFDDGLIVFCRGGIIAVRAGGVVGVTHIGAGDKGDTPAEGFCCFSYSQTNGGKNIPEKVAAIRAGNDDVGLRIEQAAEEPERNECAPIDRLRKAGVVGNGIGEARNGNIERTGGIDDGGVEFSINVEIYGEAVEGSLLRFRA